MTDSREIIAQYLCDRAEGWSGVSTFERAAYRTAAHGMIATLAAAGFRILGPDEVDAVTEAQGWRDMESAPKDGTHFVAVEQWPSGNIYARVYEWVGEPDYWREVNRGGTCIRPDYQDRYKWMPLPTPPALAQEGK